MWSQRLMNAVADPAGGNPRFCPRVGRVRSRYISCPATASVSSRMPSLMRWFVADLQMRHLRSTGSTGGLWLLSFFSDEHIPRRACGKWQFESLPEISECARFEEWALIKRACPRLFVFGFWQLLSIEIKPSGNFIVVQEPLMRVLQHF